MKSTIFTAADEEADIMEWIKDHPELYDKKLTAYKDTASKTCLWTEKSVGLNTECKLLQAWYSSMGTQFNKFTKLKSGYGTPELTEHDKWILCHFDFLRAHITHHRGRQVGGLQAKLAAASTVITPQPVRRVRRRRIRRSQLWCQVHPAVKILHPAKQL